VQTGEKSHTPARTCNGKPAPEGNAPITIYKTALKHTLEKRETEYSEVSLLFFIFVIE